MSALNNSEINPDVTIQLDIMTSIRDDDYNLVLGNEYISTEPGVLIIKDDDGKWAIVIAILTVVCRVK